MSITRTFAIDGSIAISLACALGVVFISDRFRSPETQGVGIQIERKESPAQVEPAQPLRLAVTPRHFDDMGKLLAQLGSGFSYTDFPLESLEDGAKLTQYDVLFLTCGPVAKSWVVGGAIGQGDRGTHLVRVNDEVLDRVKESLRKFVGRGGTLYVSDWRFDLIRYSFPEFYKGEDYANGADQTLTADVVDPGLRDVLGPTVELKFDLTGWRPAQLDSPQLTLYLQGEYRTVNGSKAMAPLLVKVPFEQGTIIFTSFHNEKVNSEIEMKLLRFLVFAAVTAKETSAAQKLMISGGFSPQKQTLLSASPEAPSVTQTYANAKRGRLRFALSFANQGALLRLSVRDPSGRTYEQEGASTFTIDVADGAAGNWSYTVTAQKVPYANFPFSLTVGGD